MKVAMQTVLRDQHGQPFASPRSSQAVGYIPKTLWELSEESLLLQDDISVEEMEMRVKLSLKIHEAKGPVELTGEEIEKIKALLFRACKLPWVVVQARNLLTPLGAPKEV